MPAVAVVLVVAAAAVHAGWNLLTKRSTDKLVFIWWTGAAGTVILLPAAAWLDPDPAWPHGLWPRVALAAVLRATYFLFLTAAYARGDLSVVYPVARGVGPVVVAVAGAVLLDERITAPAIAGIAAVAVGVHTVHVEGFSARALLAPFLALGSRALTYALLTGALTAAYSVVDKWNIDAGAPPVWYAYLTIPVAALLLSPLALARRTWRREWQLNRVPITLVSLMMTGSYLLVLQALAIAPVSYVAPARELGIVFAAVLGAIVLRERYGLERVAGTLLIVAGVVLIAASPPATIPSR
jgi:drug/metabolite transporter (DMT)-like permease